jgi:hypothetical protein
MHVITDLLIFILIDVISTGLFYLTGSILIPILTLGRVVAGGWTNEENDALDNKTPNTKKSKVLGAWYVMVLGGIFWAIIAVAIWRL